MGACQLGYLRCMLWPNRGLRSLLVAYIVMAYIVMAYKVIAYLVMVCIVMAYIVMVSNRGLHSRWLFYRGTMAPTNGILVILWLPPMAF